MKRKLLARLLAASLVVETVLQGWGGLTVHAEGDIRIDAEHFPDDGFRAVISRKYDTDGNGWLSDSERGVYDVKCEHDSAVRSIEGIEYFPEVRGVWCRDCNISGKVDFSKNPEITGIWCSENPITEIDITKNEKLEWIYCYKCDLTELDVTNNKLLGYLECSDNEDLTSIDLSNCPDLEHLIISSCKLESLDLSNNTKLSHLDALRTGLKHLNLGNNPNMKRLDVWDNEGLDVDISGLSGLEFYNCANNKITHLDVSNNKQLMALYCDWNKISSLDLSNNPRLADLRCGCNNLTSLDVSHNPQLYYLQIFGNRLSSININNNSRLRYLMDQVDKGNASSVYDPDSMSYDYLYDFGGDHEYMDDMRYFLSVPNNCSIIRDNPNLSAEVYDSYINKNDGLSDSSDFVTRGEAIQTLYQMAGSPRVGSSSRFTDVNGTYYEAAVAWGDKYHIALGYPNVCSDTFEGDKTITRQDLALMVHRYAEYKGWLSAFDYGRTDNMNDFFDVDYYAWGAFTYAIQWKVVPTKGNNIYPHGRITTSELNTGLKNFLEHCEVNGSASVCTSGGSGDFTNSHNSNTNGYSGNGGDSGNGGSGNASNTSHMNINGDMQKGSDGDYYLYQNGSVATGVSGFVNYDGSKFFLVNGKVDKNANGLVQDIVKHEDWYYCANGQVQTQYTGLASYDGAWFYVENGKLNTQLSGYVRYDGGLFFVGAGRLMKEVNGLQKDPNSSDWFYLANGQAQTQYTGLAQYDGEWFYVVRGKLAVNYTGYVNYNGSRFYVETGMVR